MERERPDAQTLIGSIAVSRTGERLGLIVDARPAGSGTRAEWTWVRTGIDPDDLSVLPVSGASYAHGSLVVPLSAGQVADAPRHRGGDLSPQDVEALRSHYALGDAAPATGGLGWPAPSDRPVRATSTPATPVSASATTSAAGVSAAASGASESSTGWSAGREGAATGERSASSAAAPSDIHVPGTGTAARGPQGSGPQDGGQRDGAGRDGGRRAEEAGAGKQASIGGRVRKLAGKVAGLVRGGGR